MSLILDGTLGLSDVDGSAATPAIRGTDSNTGVFFATDIVGLATGGTERMRIDSSGNVGIGTSSPSYKLDVVSTGNSINSNIAARNTTSGTAAGAQILVGNDSSNDLLVIRALSSTYTSSGVNTANGALIRGGGAGGMSLAATDASGIINFFTGGTTERMRIDSSGNVLVGTTSNTQAARLNVQGGYAYFQESGSAAELYIRSGYNTTDAAIQVVSADPLLFITNNAERMRIDSSGNVQIGTTSADGWKFNVNGSANFSGVVNLTSTSDLRWNGGDVAITNSTTNIIFKTFSGSLAERMRLTTGGELCVGKTTSADSTVGATMQGSGRVAGAMAATTNSTDTMTVYSTGASAFRFYVGMGGTIYATSTTISAISDQRLKENIKDIDVGLDAVMALKPRKFDWKEGKGKDKKGDRGWIAQEFEQVFPEMIDTWKDPAPEGEEPYKAVNADLIPVLVKAIQELKTIVDAQAAEIELLKSK